MDHVYAPLPPATLSVCREVGGTGVPIDAVMTSFEATRIVVLACTDAAFVSVTVTVSVKPVVDPAPGV
jgi:hypothetical protein